MQENQTLKTHLSFDLANNICFIKLEGVADYAAIKSAFGQSIASPKYHKGMNRLWDFRGADMSSLTTEQIRKVGGLVSDSGAGVNDVRSATVVDGSLEYGLIRMYQSITEISVKVDLLVTRSYEEAKAWVSPDGKSGQ